MSRLSMSTTNEYGRVHIVDLQPDSELPAKPKNKILSKIEEYFKLNERGSNWSTEIRAGCITFVTLSYILVVNANILAETGGTCAIPHNPNQQPPTPETIEFFECMDIVRLDLITATAIVSAVASFIMGIFANLPIALSAGMGMNAYFVYAVVGPYYEPKSISYEAALLIVFIDGCLSLILIMIGLRRYISKLIPSQLQFSITAGIGMFLTLIGLQSEQGIGVVVTDEATGITLGGCGYYNMVCQDGTGLYCGCKDTHVMTGATTWIGIIGFIIIALFMIYNFKGSIIIGILSVAILSWFRDTPFTYFPHTDEGNSRYQYFKQIVYFHPIQSTAGVLFDDLDFANPNFWIALLTFFYIDLLDSTGTLYSMARIAGIADANGHFEKEGVSFAADAIGTTFGSILGISPVVLNVESGSGIQTGAKTGITAIVVSILFIFSLFFSPILSAIPPWSTGPALIIVGCLMVGNIAKINWDDFRESFPSFIVIIIMAYTYSIAYGIIAGLAMHYIVRMIDSIINQFKNISCKSHTIKNENESEEKEQEQQSKFSKEMNAEINNSEMKLLSKNKSLHNSIHHSIHHSHSNKNINFHNDIYTMGNRLSTIRNMMNYTDDISTDDIKTNNKLINNVVIIVVVEAEIRPIMEKYEFPVNRELTSSFLNLGIVSSGNIDNLHIDIIKVAKSKIFSQKSYSGYTQSSALAALISSIIKPDIVINFGTAGGVTLKSKNKYNFNININNTVHIGDIILGETCLFLDRLRTKNRKSFNWGLWGGVSINTHNLANDLGLIKGAVASQVGYVINEFQTQLISNLNIIALDMECAPIAQILNQTNIPFLALKVISNGIYPGNVSLQEKEYHDNKQNVSENASIILSKLIQYINNKQISQL